MPVPRETREELFRSQGTKNPAPPMRMLDGFNEGWIAFEDDRGEAMKGRNNAIDVISDLVTGTEA